MVIAALEFFGLLLVITAGVLVLHEFLWPLLFGGPMCPILRGLYTPVSPKVTVIDGHFYMDELCTCRHILEEHHRGRCRGIVTFPNDVAQACDCRNFVGTGERLVGNQAVRIDG